MPRGHRERHVAAHRVADDRGHGDAQVIEQRDDVVSQHVDREAGLADRGVAEAATVERDRAETSELGSRRGPQAAVEWEWGDLTSSTVEADCEPYAAGKSTIKRRYTVEHRYKNSGGFKIILRLRKGDRVIASANAQVQVRAGLGDPPAGSLTPD